MEELARESIRGSAGTFLLKEFSELAAQMDSQVCEDVRKGTDYAVARYHAGIADGLRAACNLILQLKEQ